MWNFPLIDPSGKFFKGRLQRKKNGIFHSSPLPLGEKKKKKKEQAGAELGQAQLKLGLGYTLTIDS